MATKAFDRKFGAALLRELPAAPAVYLFKDRDGTVLYAGKARNIRRRLASYRNATRRKAHRKTLRFSAAARQRLEAHAWPGNIRELRNLMERLAYLSAGEKIEAEELAFILSPGGEAPALVASHLPLAEATDRFQIEYIKKHIERAKGNMSEAAKRMGLHRSNLYRKMRQLGMHTDEE